MIFVFNVFFEKKIQNSIEFFYSGKPLVVILSTIVDNFVGVKIFSNFFQNFFFKYMALIIIIHIGHAKN